MSLSIQSLLSVTTISSPNRISSPQTHRVRISGSNFPITDEVPFHEMQQKTSFLSFLITKMKFSHSRLPPCPAAGLSSEEVP